MRIVAALTDTFLENRRRDRLPQVLAEVVVDLLHLRGAAVTLVGPDGELSTMAHPSQDIRDLEELQLTHPDGGPTTAVIAGADATLLHATRGRFDRYGALAGVAVERGVGSVYAVPIRRRGETFGSLTLYCDPSGDLGPNEREIVRAMADIAAVGILQRRAVAAADLHVSQLEQALTSRVVIEQAKGVLLARGYGDMDEAFLALRRWARNRHQRLEDVAREVVAGTEAAAATDPPLDTAS